MKTKTAVRGGLQVAAARVVRGGASGGRCGIVADPIVAVAAVPSVAAATVLAV